MLMKTMTPLNRLSEIYVKWMDKNNLEKMSADEVLLGTPGLTIAQSNWLKRFIEIWDRAASRKQQAASCDILVI